MTNPNLKYAYLLDENLGNFEDSRVLDARSPEATDHYTSHSISSLGQAGDGFGIPVFRDEETVLTAPYSHALFVGATGSGKTIYIINQILLYLMLPPEKRPNLLITDSKGELSDFLFGLLQTAGYDCIGLDCKNGFQGNTYNVLKDARDCTRTANACGYITNHMRGMTRKTDAKELIRDAVRLYHVKDSGLYYKLLKGSDSLTSFKNKLSYVAVRATERCEKRVNGLVEKILPVDDPKDRQWFIGARIIIKGLVMSLITLNAKSRSIVDDGEVTIGSVADLIFKRDSEGDYDSLADFLHASGISDAHDAAGYLEINAKSTRDCYVSLAQSGLADWRGKSITALTGDAAHIDLGSLARAACDLESKPFALFLKPDEDDPPTGVLLNLFTSDAVSELKRAADQSAERRLARPTLFILDEFANLGGKIEEMDSFITTMRSRNVFFELFIQSYEQLVESYGEASATIIRQNCDLNAFLGTNSFNTRKEVAGSFGMSPRVVTSESVSASGTGISRSAQNAPNVRISDLEQMELGEIYVQYRCKPHLHSYVLPYFMLRKNPVAPYYKKREASTHPELNPERVRIFSLDSFHEKVSSFIGHPIGNCAQLPAIMSFIDGNTPH